MPDKNSHGDPTAILGSKIKSALEVYKPLTAAEQRAKTEAAIKKAGHSKKGGARRTHKISSKRRTHKRK